MNTSIKLLSGLLISGFLFSYQSHTTSMKNHIVQKQKNYQVEVESLKKLTQKEYEKVKSLKSLLQDMGHEKQTVLSSWLKVKNQYIGGNLSLAAYKNEFKKFNQRYVPLNKKMLIVLYKLKSYDVEVSFS